MKNDYDLVKSYVDDLFDNSYFNQECKTISLLGFYINQKKLYADMEQIERVYSFQSSSNKLMDCSLQQESHKFCNRSEQYGYYIKVKENGVVIPCHRIMQLQVFTADEYKFVEPRQEQIWVRGFVIKDECPIINLVILSNAMSAKKC